MVASENLVIFDLVGTLITPDPNVIDVYHDFGRLFDEDISRDAISSRFFRSFNAVFKESNDLTSNEDLEKFQWKEVVAGVFSSKRAHFESLFEGLWQHFAKPSNWRVYADCQSSIAKIRSLGIDIAIASNFDSRIGPIVDQLLPQFSKSSVFWSTKIGYRKPAPQFYEYIESKLSAATNVLMIGDDPVNDLQAPIDFGWQAKLLQRGGHSPSSLRSLTELLDILEP
ncbi:MAG: HAD-IA family hydrolase [Planctomycetota bacterium]